jgi:hypothetical protein
MTARELLQSWDFPRPKDIGAAEYSMIYDLLVTSIDGREDFAGCEEGTEAEFVTAILDEFEGWAKALKEKVPK